jgi:hypothetical protein
VLSKNEERSVGKGAPFLIQMKNRNITVFVKVGGVDAGLRIVAAVAGGSEGTKR